MTDSKAFGKMLTNLYTDKGISQEKFASMIKVSKNRLTEWETGAKTPNRDYATRIVKVLDLSDREITELLPLAGHPDILVLDPTDDANVEESYVFRPSGIVVPENAVGSSSTLRDQQIETFRTQLDRTQQTVEDISKKLSDIPSNQFDEQSNIMSEMNKLHGLLRETHDASQMLTARVILPSPEDLEVRLVSSTSLERLEEYRSEVNKWTTIVGILIGAVLGIICNVVTGGIMTLLAKILIGIFLLLAFLTGYTARSYQNRASKIRVGILHRPVKAVPYYQNESESS